MKRNDKAMDVVRKFESAVARNLRIAFVGALVLHCAAAQAEESGQTNWPMGVQTVGDAILPPPGDTEFYSYTQNYDAYSDTNSQGKNSVPGFRLTVLASAQRVIHTWNQSLGNFNFSSGVILAENYLSLRADGSSGSTVGLNYIYLNPLFVTYNLPKLHFMFAPSVFIPVGSYSRNNFINPAFNYYTFTQEMAINYNPTPRLEITAEPTFSVNFTDPATGYHSGANFIGEGGINYAAIPSHPNLFLGMTGYFADQFTNDTQHGVVVGDGNKLEKLAIGPQLIYYFTPATAVVFKWQHEVLVHNGPKGDRFWFEFALPL
ncbi:SphA family protein [Acidocella facilis]|uniref:SphA family protein n=1 Tax=Acidocella facilis TaxID=525 RepID=UPI001F43F8A4|nr:transporter [Acidocella facilis]